MGYLDEEVKRSRRHARNLGIAAGIIFAVLIVTILAIVVIALINYAHGCYV